MANYLLDTNHLSVLVTVNHPFAGQIYQLISSGDTFSLTTVALAELLFGLEMTPRALQNLKRWSQISVIFRYFDIARFDAYRAAQLQAELRRKGWQLGTIDALIAAVALQNNLILLTTDNDFKKIPGLQIENWIKASPGTAD